MNFKTNNLQNIKNFEFTKFIHKTFIFVQKYFILFYNCFKFFRISLQLLFLKHLLNYIKINKFNYVL